MGLMISQTPTGTTKQNPKMTGTKGQQVLAVYKGSGLSGVKKDDALNKADRSGHSKRHSMGFHTIHSKKLRTKQAPKVTTYSAKIWYCFSSMKQS